MTPQDAQTFGAIFGELVGAALLTVVVAYVSIALTLCGAILGLLWWQAVDGSGEARDGHLTGRSARWFERSDDETA